MISHILFNLFSKYDIGSFGFRKILAILITVLIFGLLYLTVRFTGIDIPNYTRNLVMLVTVDLAGFLFLMWKRPKDSPKEEIIDPQNEKEPTESKVEPKIIQNNMKQEVKEKEEEKEQEKEQEQEKEKSDFKIIIKKKKEVDEQKES
jgi:outer membrane biosynthesis protein TonB